MKGNILAQILHAESEYNEKIEHVDEQVEAYKCSIETKRGDELQALQQERCEIEQRVNAKFLQAYSESEEALTAAIDKQKEALRLSINEKSAAIVRRLKNEILAEFFPNLPENQFEEGAHEHWQLKK